MQNRLALCTAAAAMMVALAPSLTAAKMETRTLPTVKCNIDQVKQAGGAAVVRAATVGTKGATRVTIDTKKGSWRSVNQKLLAAGCMKK
jgi:hypothetical protein